MYASVRQSTPLVVPVPTAYLVADCGHAKVNVSVPMIHTTSPQPASLALEDAATMDQAKLKEEEAEFYNKAPSHDTAHWARD